jgi:hypothetical protein
VTEATQSQAQRLLAALTAQGESIENIVVMVSRKGDPFGSITVGTTGQTSIMWSLGAMDYARWHFFEQLSMHRAAKSMAFEQAQEDLAMLQEHGVKPS